jgi:hypothetical protein
MAVAVCFCCFVLFLLYFFCRLVVMSVVQM